MFRRIFSIAILVLATTVLSAREGMWIPSLLNRNIAEMHEMGFQLSIDDLYNVNTASIKDAIVLFGSGCTGEVISPDGLLITNHHCAHSAIQKHSSLDHNYLADGFWAKSRSEELPNENLSVSFLIEMRDITNEILAGTDSLLSDTAIAEKIRENSAIAVDEAIDGTPYNASVKSFFSGNQYFLIITEKFTDIRLVGAPPSSIGNFGGDTDNWMWPRHTGDFSMFRIYADSTNRPAAYSPNNVPYHPKKYLPVNLNGFKEGDFAMVYGFPASTQNNLYSKAIEQIVDQRDPDRIDIRSVKLQLMTSAMSNDTETRIKYAAKARSSSNAWKKWQGEIKGLQRLDAVKIKQQQELAFQEWVNADVQRKYKYGSLLDNYSQLYDQLAPYQKARDYFDEIVMRGTDVYQVYNHLRRLLDNNSEINVAEESNFLDKHFKDVSAPVDLSIFVSLLSKYHHDLKLRFKPKILVKIFEKKNPEQKLEKIFNASLLSNKNKLSELLKSKDIKQLERQLKNDQLFALFEDFGKVYYDSIIPEYNQISKTLKQLQREYVGALMEMNGDQLIYPDANQTLRVSYGKIEGYVPADGVVYDYYTTIDGMIEKDDPEVYDYDVPERLHELYSSKDYGRYANEDGKLPVCFIASNHTTGGNSGSPVLDRNGYLIGINFDRCWEGTMSDIMFEPEKCRNISLDMRYMLFIIDKFAGASYLLDEMMIINSK